MIKRGRRERERKGMWNKRAEGKEERIGKTGQERLQEGGWDEREDRKNERRMNLYRLNCMFSRFISWSAHPRVMVGERALGIY